MDRPGQTGYLLLNEEGAVISSAGDLENDEKSAVIIMGLINLTSQIDSNAFPPEEEKYTSLRGLCPPILHITLFKLLGRLMNFILYLTKMKFMQIIILFGGIFFSLYQLYCLLNDME